MRGNTYNCLAVCELIYSIQQTDDLPDFPKMSGRLLLALRGLPDVIEAQAAWLEEHQNSNPNGVLVARGVQDGYTIQEQALSPNS